MRLKAKYCLFAAASVSLLGSGTEALAQTSATLDGKIEEVVVTARRRAEAAQDTPLSLTALTSEQLQQKNISTLVDINTAVPGIRLFVSGSAINTVFSIRGMSRGVQGNEQSAVATYVNDVPIPSFGANIPTYDLENIQVLKGPQGTLFGRNASAGAILITTKQPGYKFGGYIDGTFGSYSWQQYEGALNIPLLQDHVALRLAGQIARRDGYTKNMSFPGQDFDDVHTDTFRASLLTETSDTLKNVLVYDYAKLKGVGTGAVLYGWDDPSKNPAAAAAPVNFVPWVNGTLYSLSPLTPCGGRPVCDIGAAMRRQIAAGPRRAWSPFLPYIDSELQSVTNTTSLSWGPVKAKNIFGYRTVKSDLLANLSGYDALLIAARNVINAKQISDELQFSGMALSDNLEWIAGLFYVDSKPGGPGRLTVGTFFPPGTPYGFAPGSSDYYHSKSQAVYGQINYKLGGLSSALKDLSVDAGLRYSKDRNSQCSIGGLIESGPIPPESACHTPVAAEYKKLTYTFGLNYNPTPDVLVYAVTRRGYRGGGLNAPKLGGTLTGFQFYRPETVTDYEVGIKSDWRRGNMLGRFNAALFRADYDDVHAGIPSVAANALPGGPDGDGNSGDDPPGNFYANVGSARVQGLEADAAFSPFAGLELTASATWLDKKITQFSFTSPPNWAPLPPLTSNLLPNYVFLGSPDSSYTLGLNYRRPLENQLGVVVFNTQLYHTSTVNFGTVHAPSWSQVDLKLSWERVLGHPINASVFVKNANNNHGVSGSAVVNQGLGMQSIFYNSPRMVGVEMRYAFGQD